MELHILQEYRQLSGRLNKCKAEKDAATLRSQQLHISLVKLEEETRQKELAAAEELPGDYDAKHPEVAPAYPTELPNHLVNDQSVET